MVNDSRGGFGQYIVPVGSTFTLRRCSAKVSPALKFFERLKAGACFSKSYRAKVGGIFSTRDND